MNRVKYFFVILILSNSFFVRAGDGFVYLKDTTHKLFFVSNNKIYTPDKGQLLYSQQGNIFYGGSNDSKDNISLLVTSLDPGSSKLESIFEKDQRQPVYSFMDNKFYLGKATTEEARRKNELLHIESSKKWVGLYASDNDSLLAYYRIDSFPPSTAIIVAYTLIRKFELEKRPGVPPQEDQQEEHHKVTFSFITPFSKQAQTPPVTGAYSVIKPALGNALANEWIWDGKILRPRWNTDPNLRWTFDGQIIKKDNSDNNTEQYSWDGKAFKPMAADDLSQQWYWNGNTMKRAENTGWHNEYIIDDGLVRPTTYPSAENEWYLEGTIPIPLVILIISGIAKVN